VKRILLIEDNTDVRENTAEILMLSQYEVLTAANGKEGVELALKELPDLIICDIMMPVLDGHGVLHLLSRNAQTASIPFIFLTAKTERGDIRKGMEMGADDYLTKPFDDVELLTAIDVRLKKHDLMKKEFTQMAGIASLLRETKAGESLEELSLQKDIRHYSKKEEVFREGNYPKGIYFISKGKIKICRRNDQGKELITALHSEGEFFGYLSLLKDEAYTDAAVVLEDAEVYMLPKADFFALIDRDADVARRFIGMLSEDLREMEQELVRLAYNSVRKRVAQALIRLSDKYKKEDQQPFSMQLSREDLANLVGTSTETVIRTLSDLKEDQYIAISGSTITVLDYDKLVAMKN
jgi:CRP-like cAMP-binding protein/ActR/RegA family two-component response regulator